MLERARVGAVQAHDLAGREHPPQVGRGVVAQRRQLAPRRRMAQRARVEVQLRVGDDALPVGHERLLQVAHAHVVGDDGEVVAAELALGEVQVARRRLDRLGRVEALVDAPAHRLALAHAPAAQDAARQALGGLDVDVQAEQVLAGLGEDLGQARGRAQVVRRARVGPPGRLEHDDRLEHVGVEPVGAGDAVDDRPPVRGAPGRGHDAARALGEEHVAEAERGVALVGGALRGDVVERLRRGHAADDAGAQRVLRALIAAAAVVEGHDEGRPEQGEQHHRRKAAARMHRGTGHAGNPATSGRIHNVMGVQVVAASELPPRVALEDDLLVHGDNLDVLPRLPDGAFDVIYIDPPFNTGRDQRRRTLRVVADEEGDRTGFAGRRYRTEEVAIAGLRRRLRGLRRLPRTAPAPRPPPARRARHALRPPRRAREPLRQGPPRHALRARVLPQRDRVGLRLRGQDAPALAGQARHHPRLRQGPRRLPLRRRRGGARALPGARRSWGPRRRPAASASPTRGFTPSSRPTGPRRPATRRRSPAGVVRRMVAASSRPGGWCLDFFAGSGTLGAVARELGRRFVLVDCHPDAIEVASRRLATSAGAPARARPRA